MDAETRKKVRPGCQYLQSLARNRSGNIFVMMAAFLIPMTFLAGSGLDIGRLYLVKVRLQQACDAGVLAGRKAMTATSGTSIDASGTTVASTRANELFTSNFHSGWMGTSSVSFTPNRTNANEVTATAAATVPMTITRLFNNSNAPMNVSCTARFDVGDTDVMFVLDTTGSMACTTANDTGNGCGASPVSYTRPDGTTGWHATEQSGSKISGLRSAVLSFYDTLLSHSSTATHIRYGFVTYTSTVNAGYLLPSGYLVDNWNYNTRQVVGDANNGSSSNTTYNNVSSSTCDGYVRRTPVTALTYNTNGTASVTTKVSFSGTSSTNGSCVIKSQPVRPNWSYGNFTLDTSQFKLGNTINDPSKITAAMSVWQGCLEERNTTASSSFSQSSLPNDLDPDLVPSNTSTKWRPMWPDVVYYRGNVQTPSTIIDTIAGSNTVYGDTSSTSTTGQFTNMIAAQNISSGYVSCGKPAQRLAIMTRTQVSNYVNASDFVPQGGTYHDTGMIWGTRLISPTGIFASDTAAWPGNNPPARYIVFMTDGDMAPNNNIYGMYGMEYYDGRVTGVTGNSTSTNDKTYHNTRFQAECSAAKARNITVFVISFGTSLTSDMSNCASPGNAFSAGDNASLLSAFNSIALNVAALRLSQ